MTAILPGIARRTFLVGAAAVAGGVAVVCFAEARDDLPHDGQAGDSSTLGPYIRIDAQGVTLITPRADMGQGATSMQAALIAEEMDLAWGRFRTETAGPGTAYFNGDVLAEGFPIRATSDGFGARMGRELGKDIARLLGFQITGGSTTVRDGFDKLRMAGAVARLMLLEAAAQQSGVPVAQLKTRDGSVILPDGKALSYASLGAAAAKVSRPSDVVLKPRGEWRYLGQPMQRLDTVSKSTGTAVYGIDLRLPGMVYATVRANPRMGGGIHSFDARDAEKAKGVIQVVSLSGGFGVIADNTWRAFQAAAMVKPEWGASPYPETSAALFQSVAEAFDHKHDSRLRDDGDVEAALKAAGTGVLQAEYRVPYLAHAPMEPVNAVVQFKDGRLDIWTGTQIPGFLVQSAARVSRLDTQDIHLHVQMMGGSFGRRLEDDYVRQAVQLAMAYPGVPIKMTWTREEDMTHDFPRPLAIARMRGAVRDRQVQAFDLSIASPSVTDSQFSRMTLKVPVQLHVPGGIPDIAIVAGAWDQPLALPNYRVTGYRATPSVPVSSWRSVGASGNGFVHESAFDELLQAAGADALAERLRICTHEPSRRVLQTVGEISGWGKPLANGSGRGLAFTLSFGVPVAEVVEVTLTDSNKIRIDKVYVACEVGKVLDPVNFEAQVQGGVVWGLGHAINCELTYADGMPQQTNFPAHPGLRLYQTPQIVLKALETTDEVKGIGEPCVPPAAPALANAIFAATGRRIRELPLNKSVEFV
jgi:isoquinoline 1-oxidoreductase subunit beta